MNRPTYPMPTNTEFLELPEHQLVIHELRLAMDGVQSAIVYGPRGVGKTSAATYAIQVIREEERQRAAGPTERDSLHEPRDVVMMTASTTTGVKTVLTDLYQAITGFELGRGTRRAQSPHALIQQIVAALQAGRYHAIVIDEAQLLRATDIDLLRQVPDAAAQAGHHMGLLLVGSEELRAVVRDSGQLGQRFAGEVAFPRITRQAIGPQLTTLFPDLAPVKRSMTKAAWTTLEADLFTASHGTLRRLVIVIHNARALARYADTPLDEDLVRAAIDKLSEG